MKLTDGQVFKGEKYCVIFNHYSFCELIKHIMVKYGDVSFEVADEKVNTSFLTKPVKSINELFCLSHELEYHWAMLLLYGEMYWTRGIASNFMGFKDEYWAWETEIRQKYHLKDSFDFLAISE